MIDKLVKYLDGSWNKNSNPQAGFRFECLGKMCEVWFKTHSRFQFLYIFKDDGGFTAHQIEILNPKSLPNQEVERIINSMMDGFINFTPIEFDDSVEGCMVRTDASFVS